MNVFDSWLKSLPLCALYVLLTIACYKPNSKKKFVTRFYLNVFILQVYVTFRDPSRYNEKIKELKLAVENKLKTSSKEVQ